jgi:hypothetical protein
MANNIQMGPAVGGVLPNNKTKIFNLIILPMINQNMSNVNSFKSQVTYSKGLLHSILSSTSWWTQMNNYFSSVSGIPTSHMSLSPSIPAGQYVSTIPDMMGKSGLSVKTLNTVTMPFSGSNNMTDFYVQLWIRSLVNSSYISLLRPNSGKSSQEVANVLAIQTNVNVVNTANQTTCVDVCAYHSSVDVSDITGIANQSVLYMVLPHITSSCGPCNSLSSFQKMYNSWKQVDTATMINIFGPQYNNFLNFLSKSIPNFDISIVASHELEEVVMNYALGSLKDTTKSEVADVCAVMNFDL